MNASSESGLWALTITRGSTDVIRNWDETPPKFTLLRVIAHHRTEKNRVTKTKRAVIQQRVNPETSSAIIQIAHHALGPHSCRGHSGIRSLKLSVLPCPLAEDEAAPIFVRFYLAPPASPGGPALKRRRNQ